MTAVLWKKIKEISNQKFKIAILILLPIAISVLLIINPININNISSSLPLLNIILCWIIMFNIEDFVYAEVVFGTGISIWDMWLINIGCIIATGFFYTILQFTFIIYFTGIYQHINLIVICKMIISFITGFGLICFSTHYICDYSKKRNYISSIGGIFNFVILSYIVMTYCNATLISTHLLPLFIVSLILAVYSIVMVCKYSKIENFVNNVKQLSDGYDNKNYIEE